MMESDVHHDTRFGLDSKTGEHMAVCSCGWRCKSLSLTEVQLRASVHDLDAAAEVEAQESETV